MNKMIETIFSKIEAIIDDEYKCNGIKIFSEDKNDKFPNIKITNLGKNIVLKPDNSGKKIYNFLNEVVGVQEKSDYIIFVTKNDILYSIILELKPTDVRKAVKQTFSGKLIAEVIINIAKRLSNNYDFNNIVYKRLIFTTNPSQNKKHTKNYYLDEQAIIYFKDSCGDDIIDISPFLS